MARNNDCWTLCGIDSELITQAADRAARSRMTLGDFVTRALEAALARDDANPPAWSPADLAGALVPPAAIAARLDALASPVQPPQAPIPPSTAGPAGAPLKRKRSTGLTEEIRRRVHRLRAQGLPYRSIAADLFLSSSTVAKILKERFAVPDLKPPRGGWPKGTRKCLIRRLRSRHLFQPVDEAKVEALMASIREDGLREPVTTEWVSHGLVYLVDGWVRLEACRRLGYVTIPCLDQ